MLIKRSAAPAPAPLPHAVASIVMALSMIALPAIPARAQDAIPPAAITDLNSGTGTVRYVDRSHPSATDSGPGTQAAPWRTILYAARTARAGETVLIKRGTYPESESGRVEVSYSGTAGNPITFAAYPGDERQVIITGASFRITGRSHIVVRGLKVTGVLGLDARGFSVEGPGTNITLSGNETYDTQSSGIGVWGVRWSQDPGNYQHLFNVVVENNLIRLACNGGYDECITVANGVNNVIVRNNEITQTGNTSLGGEGIDFKEGVFGGQIQGNYVHDIEKVAIYLDAAGVGIGPGGVESINISGNLVANITNGAGIEVGTEGRGSLRDINVFNNVVRGAKNALLLYAHPSGTGTATGVSFINNTVYLNSAYGIRIDYPAARASGLVARNNISHLNAYGNYSVSGSPAVAADHNLLGIDPLFVNAVAGDLRLRAGSPAVDAGSPTGAPAVDFAGISRPQGAIFDIGAYELVQGSAALSVAPDGGGR
ncbi:MAG TPA: choice-of-anchor Q domain-containing protein [Candidatus Eisenbacteria bacterium]|nr:choice-of-anchor Q domain-containing protein [Candidatus Eisenbacteria bacterium]